MTTTQTQPQVTMSENRRKVTHLPWPKTPDFTTVVRGMRRTCRTNTTVTYRGKVKLHGTNAAVQVFEDGSVWAQSRNRLLGPTDKHSGFREWVAEHRGYWSGLRPGVYYGEWIGPGIQKGVALAQMERKVFMVFAYRSFQPDAEGAVPVRTEVDPFTLLCTMVEGPAPAPRDLFISQWATEPFDVDFADTTSLKAFADQVAPLADAIDAECPVGRDLFKVKGHGEGLVFFPIGLQPGAAISPADALWRESGAKLFNLVFKAKGTSHTTSHVKKHKSGDALADGIPDEVAAWAVQAVNLRGDQMRQEHQLELSMRNTGAFITAISSDIQTEEDATIEAMCRRLDLKPKAVMREACRVAAGWWKAAVRAEGM